jgi:hypothetical protein
MVVIENIYGKTSQPHFDAITTGRKFTEVKKPQFVEQIESAFNKAIVALAKKIVLAKMHLSPEEKTMQSPPPDVELGTL